MKALLLAYLINMLFIFNVRKRSNVFATVVSGKMRHKISANWNYLFTIFDKRNNMLHYSISSAFLFSLSFLFPVLFYCICQHLPLCCRC